MKDLKVQVSVPEGADTIYLNVDNGVNNILKNHLVGFYYWMYDELGHLKQYGFQPYNTTGTSTNIAFGDMVAGSKIRVRLEAIYDTGRAGINLNALHTSIPDVTVNDDSVIQTPGTKEDFYAIQVLNSNTYASSEQINETLNLNAASAGGTLYQIADVSNDPDHSIYKNYIKVYKASRYPTRYRPAIMEYMYGTQGAYTQDDKMPVFKELRQTGIVLAAADSSIAINATGTEAEMTVPMTRPHVDRRNAVQQGFHTADVTVRF